MLTPDYLARAPDKIVKLYQRLEEYIITDIARRLRNTGEITTTAQWQSWVGESIGSSIDKIQVEVARLTGKCEAEVLDLFEDAARRALQYDDAIYKEVGMQPEDLDQSPALTEYMEVMRRQTNGELKNITQSLGFAEQVGGKTVFKPVAKVYQDTLDFAHAQISSGAADYHTAVRQAIGKLVNSGLRTVDYQTGWSNRVDVAARRATLTGISQTAGKLSEMRADEMGADLMEITAHAGARPSHAVWQGKIVSRSGKPGYLSLADVGYGDVRGFKGANCRHDWHPYFEGRARSWTEKELRKIDPPPFIYEGKRYTAYEATQQQRKIETAIRRSKELFMAYNAAGLDEQSAPVAARMHRQRELYKSFSNAAGLKLQTERQQFYGFNRSMAAKATAAAKKAS